MKWQHKGSAPSKKNSRQNSQLAIMASVFWNSEGTIHVDFIPHAETINAQC
jgi:hypothetical protein